MMYAVATLASTISDRTAFAMTLERREEQRAEQKDGVNRPAEYENISQVQLGKGRLG